MTNEYQIGKDIIELQRQVETNRSLINDIVKHLNEKEKQVKDDEDNNSR